MVETTQLRRSLSYSFSKQLCQNHRPSHTEGLGGDFFWTAYFQQLAWRDLVEHTISYWFKATHSSAILRNFSKKIKILFLHSWDKAVGFNKSSWKYKNWHRSNSQKAFINKDLHKETESIAVRSENKKSCAMRYSVLSLNPQSYCERSFQTHGSVVLYFVKSTISLKHLTFLSVLPAYVALFDDLQSIPFQKCQFGHAERKPLKAEGNLEHFETNCKRLVGSHV